MSEAKYEKPVGNRKAIAEAFEDGRKFHVGIGIITIITSIALLSYLVSFMGELLTSTPVDPALALMPGLWLGACIAIAWGLSVFQSINQPLRGNYMPRRIVKASGIVGMGAAIAMDIGLLILVASGSSAVAFSGVSLYFIIANFVVFGASWAGLYGATELRNPEAPKETRLPEDLNKPMKIGVFLRRTFSYCGRHYGAILVLMIGITVVARALSAVFMSPWYASLLNEEQSLIAWLTQNNFTIGMTAPADIYNRYSTLYNVQSVFVYFKDVFESCFYYAMLGIGITIIMKSYEGGDSRISTALRNARSHIGPLIIISIIFSIFYNLLLLPIILFVPGLIFYTYCIFAFPNLLFVGKYRTLQNFGEAKNRISGNFWRTFVYSLVIYFVPFTFQLLLQYVLDAVVQGVGGTVVLRQWRMDPFGNLGNLMLLEVLTGLLTTFTVPLEASLIAMLFFDLAARKRVKVMASAKSPSEKARVQSLSSASLGDRTQKARYCPRCGLSVRKGITRCPNCKAEVPLEKS